MNVLKHAAQITVPATVTDSGGVVQDNLGDITFASSDTSLITVNQNGLVTRVPGAAAGKATITVTATYTDSEFGLVDAAGTEEYDLAPLSPTVLNLTSVEVPA